MSSSSSSSSSSDAASSSSGSAPALAPAPASSSSSSAPAAKRVRDGEGDGEGDGSGGTGGAEPAAAPPPAPFRGPAADSRLGELLLDALPLACAVGHALDLSHCLALCGATWRRGVARADGSLDRAGFLGGTNDMMARSLERQAPWLAGARKMRREAGGVTQLARAVREGDEQRVRELVAAGAPLDLVLVSGVSALDLASDRGCVSIVKLLLDGKYEGKGAGFDTKGCMPLIFPLLRGHEAVMRLLLERGANAARPSVYGTALLAFATTDAIKVLLREHGAID
jgi:hypothetical protein